MGLSPEEAFAILGLSPAASPREVRRRYATLARRWHPDRAGALGEAKAHATRRMAEINAAYRVARQYAQPRVAGGAVAIRASSPRGVGYVRSWSLWEHEPGTHEWRGLRAVKGLALAGVVGASAELITRITPAQWVLAVWTSALVVTGAGMVLLFRGGQE